MVGKMGDHDEPRAILPDDTLAELSQRAIIGLEPLYNPHGIKVVHDSDLVSRICKLGLTEVKNDFGEVRPNVERYQFDCQGKKDSPDLTIRLSQYPDWYIITGNRRDSVDPAFHADIKIEVKEPSNDTAKKDVVAWIRSYLDRMAKPR